MRRLLLISLLLLGCLGCPAQLRDMGAARDYCDATPLQPVEGIWELPKDGIKVLIHRQKDNPSHYDLTIVESERPRLRCGEVIGHLTATPMADRFEMKMVHNLKRHMRKCSATLTSDQEGLIVTSESWRMKINPFGLIPYFWRLVRINSVENPAKPPYGMVKIYPSYDGNGSSRRQPRYL